MMVEHYIDILPFKSPQRVMCHQPATLEEAVVLMEAYASVAARAYLIPKVWKGQQEKKWPDRLKVKPENGVKAQERL